MAALSVVLISKNQEWNMARLVESVLRHTAASPETEVVLVDSASSDGTTTLASHFPIRVLRLRPDQPLTPAAGRYVGHKHTSGEFVLFLDGDMVLCRGFLQRAIEVLETAPDVGVVGGRIVDVLKHAELSEVPGGPWTGEFTEVGYCPGAALYRRSVLDRVGNWNPFLCSDGEPELCLRIRHAGYKAAMIDYPVVYHRADPAEAISTLIGRWRRELYRGPGQAIRYHLRSRLLWAYLRERGYGIAPALATLGGAVACVLSIWTGEWTWLGFWAAGAGAVVGLYAWRNRSLYRTCASLVKRLLIVEGTFRGLLTKPVDPNSYPGKFDVIRNG